MIVGVEQIQRSGGREARQYLASLLYPPTLSLGCTSHVNA